MRLGPHGALLYMYFKAHRKRARATTHTHTSTHTHARTHAHTHGLCTMMQDAVRLGPREALLYMYPKALTWEAHTHTHTRTHTHT